MKTWWLLYRQESDTKVYLYQPMFGKELNRMKREGWRVIE